MRRRRNQSVVAMGTTTMVILLLIGLGLAAGWVMNIISIIGSDFSHIDGLLIMRCIGVFLAPIGGVLGYF